MQKRKKSNKIKGSVRSSQLVTTYGVGAMLALGNESFIVAGIEDWPKNDEDVLHEPRLERKLGVFEFRRPPAGDDISSDIPVRRFPEYQSCPQCHRLNRYNFFTSPFGKAVCSFCEDEPALVPSRFVVACEDGHLDDFPYYQWAHSQQPHDGGTVKLKLKSRGESSGLRDVIISCSCGASRSMDGAFSRQALRTVRRCQGRRPWLGEGTDEGCDKFPVAVQRGASNVWFPDHISAISIPPWSEGAFRVLDRGWEWLKLTPPGDALRLMIEAKGLADEYHSVDDLVGAAEYRKRQESGEADAIESDVKYKECEALMKGAPEKDRHDEFVCVPAISPGELARDWFPIIQKVTRLREVRALRGFSRLVAPAGSDEAAELGGEAKNTVGLQADEVGWLPAIEVTGEGVFFELSSARLKEWENQEAVQQRVNRLAERFVEAYEDGPSVTPRFVMIHTLAHALIDQWALECGYPAAALRERIYVTTERAGVLIYTATTDSAGSLGGVISMAEDDRLSSSLVEAIRRSAWCSADPLCIETATQGVDALNLAACHACALLPETSCEWRNQLLDRALLVGTPEDPSLGYFTELV